jgi:hypothetical protein
MATWIESAAPAPESSSWGGRSCRRGCRRNRHASIRGVRDIGGGRERACPMIALTELAGKPLYLGISSHRHTMARGASVDAFPRCPIIPRRPGRICRTCAAAARWHWPIRMKSRQLIGRCPIAHAGNVGSHRIRLCVDPRCRRSRSVGFERGRNAYGEIRRTPPWLRQCPGVGFCIVL